MLTPEQLKNLNQVIQASHQNHMRHARWTQRYKGNVLTIISPAFLLAILLPYAAGPAYLDYSLSLSVDFPHKHLVLSSSQTQILRGLDQADIEPVMAEQLPECGVKYRRLFSESIAKKIGAAPNREADQDNRREYHGPQQLVRR